MGSDDHSEFGSGYDLESGDYPTPESTVPEKHIGESGAVGEAVDQREVEYSDVSGIILDFVPQHLPFKYEKREEPPVEITTVFVGSAGLWYRITFWGSVGAEVSQRLADTTAPLSLTMNIHGIASYDRDIRDVNILSGDGGANWTLQSDAVHYDPTTTSESVDATDIEPETAVPLLLGDVISTTGPTTRSKQGENFKVNNIAAKVGDKYVLIAAYDHHATKTVSQFDTIGVYSGYGAENQLNFVPETLPSLEYEGEVSLHSFSGLCNFSEHPHIDIG